MTFYLLRCLTCDEWGGRDLVIPFGSESERGKYAAAHTKGTGHDRWNVWTAAHATETKYGAP